MELLKTSITLYQRHYCLERKEFIPPSEVLYQVKTDTLLSITIVFNRLEGLYVMLNHKEYEFFEEIHWVSPFNNFEDDIYPSLENIESELSKAVKTYIGIDLVFSNVRGTMLYNLLLSVDLTDSI